MTDLGHIGGPIVIPGCVQVRFRWALNNGKIGKNVMYGTVGGGFVATAAVAEALRAAISGAGTWTALAAYIAPGTSIAGVDLLDVRTANNAIVSSTGAALPGTSAQGAIPEEMAVALTLRTAKTGPAYRGRIYIPGLATNAIGAAGVVLAATVTALSNFGGAIPGLLSGQGITMAIGQPARAAYTGSTGTFHAARVAQSTPVTSVLCRDNHFDSQRRRGLK